MGVGGSKLRPLFVGQQPVIDGYKRYYSLYVPHGWGLKPYSATLTRRAYRHDSIPPGIAFWSVPFPLASSASWRGQVPKSQPFPRARATRTHLRPRYHYRRAMAGVIESWRLRDNGQ